MIHTLAALSLVGAPGLTGKVDVAEFGMPSRGAEQQIYAPALADRNPATEVAVAAGEHVQVEWKQPRDISSVVIRGANLPDPSQIELQWWSRIWPDNGGGGWMRLDDPFNGKWVTISASVARDDGSSITYTFAPLTKAEDSRVEHEGNAFRRTYKIRAVFKTPAHVSALETYGGAAWESAQIRLQWKPKSDKPIKWDGKIEVRNGRLISETSDAGGAIVNLQYADSPYRLCEDRGYVVFRAPGLDSFSVFVDDVVREGGIYVRDIDAYISDGSKNLTFKDYKKPDGAWDGTVIEKLSKMPEQSLQNVMKNMPAKPEREAPLGVPDMRQEFVIDPFGDIYLQKNSLRSPGVDADRRPWDAYMLKYTVSTDQQPKFTDGGGRKVTRHLEDGYLPVVHSQWRTGGIEYSQSAFATMLMEKIGENAAARKGDEPLLLMDKVEITNTAKTAQTAWLWIEPGIQRPMTIASDGALLLKEPTDGKARADLTPTRGRFDTRGKGEIALVANPNPSDPELGQAIRYSVTLQPGEKHAIYLNLTYVELLETSQLSVLRSARWEDRLPDVLSFWRKRINEDSPMKYEVPEEAFNDLWKANLWHVLITTDKDPATGYLMHGASTFHYRVFANETGMVSQSLEMRGEHDYAVELLRPLLENQSYKLLPGNFRNKDGCFWSAYPTPGSDPYTAQGYNMHHGWVLWNLCEHYKWTHDRAWLESIAPQLVKGCDWITKERQATMVMNPDGTKPVEYGLAPAGDLEDVEEFLHFYATNAYYYVGMKSAAEVLKEIVHPDAARIAADAEAYKKDIMASVAESVATSPVVELKDGTYIPYVPQRAYALTHRKEGWIREGLYPALHLLDGQLVEPNHPYMTWILQDLEDNIFLSKESGYGVDDQLKNFYNFGGFNLQPNLLPNSFAHLRRDEVPQFLRVLYNEFWASYWPDTVCFAEWVSYYGKGDGPLYKTPDECKFIQYMRDMLVFEEGDALKLGMGVPRKWMEDGKKIRIENASTFFGNVDLRITSEVAKDRIVARVTLPTRNPAKESLLRLRHPDGKRMTKVTINGQAYKSFDPARELITLPGRLKDAEVVAYY